MAKNHSGGYPSKSKYMFGDTRGVSPLHFMVPGNDFWGTNFLLFVGVLSWNDFGVILEPKRFTKGGLWSFICRCFFENLRILFFETPHPLQAG